jgi:hypothetical protein
VISSKSPAAGASAARATRYRQTVNIAAKNAGAIRSKAAAAQGLTAAGVSSAILMGPFSLKALSGLSPL